jgi:hypothetical protein
MLVSISNKEYIQQRKNILLGLQEAGVIDKRIFDANGKVIDTKKGNNDSVKMLKWLIDNSPSEDYKIIAQKTYQSLLSLKKIGYKFPFKIVNEESSFRGRITPLQADGKTRASDKKRTAVLSMTIADPSANYLFNKDRWRSSNGVNFETLLHENIHQATVAQMFATRDGNATGDAQSFARIEKAFEELESQQKRLKKHYDDRIKYYRNASKQLNNPKVQKEISKKLFDLVVNNPIEAKIAQIFIKENSDAPYTYIQQDTYLSEINLKAFRDFEIGYQLFGKRKQTNRDVSEMLTFGLTNRSFQKMLESIPYKNNKTLWQGFVESVRKILGIPAKLDTELSAFLSNAAEVLDAQAIGLEPINPRAPPKTKETDQSSYGTMPTKAVITSPFKQDTSIPEKPWRGKINGFEVELQRNPDASGGESVWSAYLPPRTQEVNGVMLSGDGGLDLRNNRKESTEFLLDQWQSMLNRGYTINPYNGFAQWQMKKVITLEDSRQDVPTFSRISKRGELDNRIADLDRRIEIKENTLRQDSQYLGTASYNRMSNEIDVLKGQRARLVEERNNLPPEQIPLFSRGPRDESSGHVADFLPAQYGPPAHQLDLEASGELTSEGYSTASFGFTYPKTSPDYRTREFKIYSTARTPQEIQEEREFVIKLMEIKGNPNATITMYQAAPSRDLRKGDLITPFLSDAQYYVDQSKVTQEEVRDADKARRRQEQINKTGAVDLQQERLFNQMEGISDILGRPSQATPSTIHTYELKAGDVRWDGNNGWARWGYFPSNVVGINGNIPLFSRAATKIIVSERNMGVGTSVMNDLTNYADINNKVITLTPSKDFGRYQSCVC